MNLYPSGTRIAGRYEVLKTLTGGMGIVYLCLDRQQDLPVALKTFQPQFLSDRAARDRFLREGTVWVDLGRHLHIVHAHSVEHIGDGREVYLALEWVAESEGKRDASLRAWLTPGKSLPLEQALLFALHIARGMKYAASKIPGLVHRDLKPENVLVGRDGIARVTDFGLASTLQGLGEGAFGTEGTEGNLRRTQLTHGGITGTPWYMAPEQWMPGEHLDARADIYAFGCILYEMVAGKMAVVGNNLRELELAHLAGRVGELPRGLPGEVSGLVKRCLAVKRKGRYASWSEVEAAVVKAYARVAGRDAPGEVSAESETRAERVAAGWSYVSIGNSYVDISKFEVAMEYFERVVKIGRAEKERELEGAALGNLGVAYKNSGDPRGAIEYHEQALAIYREIGNRAVEGQTLGNLGTAYDSLGEPRRAIGYHEQSLEIFRETGDRTGEGKALGNLGAAYWSLGEPRRAIEYFEQDLKIAREIGDRAGEGAALGNLGAAYGSLGDPRRAIEYQEQRLKIAGEIGDVMGAAQASHNLARALADQGQQAEALRHAEYAAQVFKQVGHAQYAQMAQRLIARIRGQKQ